MKYSALLLSCLIPFILSAQKNFLPGYIVNLQGDTIKGFIDYKEWTNPTSIVFRPASAGAVEKEYTVNDIVYFEITGNEAYRRAIVEISLDPVNLNNINGRDTSSKIDTVFLKVLYAGNVVDLFSYTDVIKERFYILEGNQLQPKELVLKKYYRNSSTLITEDVYRNQLRVLMYAYKPSSNVLSNRINDANYEVNDLMRIVLMLNSQSESEQTLKNKTMRPKFFAGIGVQRDNAKFEGDHRFAQSAAITTLNWLPRFAAGIDLFANPNVGKVFFRIEAGYQLNKSRWEFTGNADKGVYELSGSTITVSPQLHCALYNSHKLKIPFGVGFNYIRPNYSKNLYREFSLVSGKEMLRDENYLAFRKGIFSVIGRVSAVFNNQVEASFIYRPFTTLTSEVVKMGASNVQFQVYYLFRKKK